MKKAILFVECVSLLMAGILSVSCKKSELVPQLSVTPAAIGVESGVASDAIAILCDADWTAAANEEWITLSPTSGTGNGAIAVNVDANAAPEPREAIITVQAGAAAQTITVTQEGFVPAIRIDKTIINAAAAAGAYPLVLTGNIAWTAGKGNAAWIALSPTEGTGSGTITVAIAKNDATEPRSATITVTADDIVRTVNVLQAAANASLEVDGTELSYIPEEAAAYSLPVTGNTAWTAESSATWLTVSPATGTGSGTITVNAEANTVMESRSATITVTAGNIVRTVSVTQAAAVPALEVNGTELNNIPEEEADYSLPVTSNTAWTAKSNAAWLTVSPTTGTGSGTIAVTVTENPTLNTRTATITVTAGNIVRTVSVTQAGIAPSLAINAAVVKNIPAWKTSYSLTVTSNSPWTVEKSDDAWLTVSPTTGQGNGSITIAVAENTAAVPRTATVTVRAGSLTQTASITQAAMPDLNETAGITFTGNDISFTIVAQNASIDWGDGSPKEYANTNGYSSFSHSYGNGATRSVTIKADKLSYYDCSDQQLTALDVSGCTDLATLECSGNRLTALNISGNTELTKLNCGNNRLTALDVSNNVKLTELYCPDNQLTALNVNKCPALVVLFCYNNLLSVDALNALFASMPNAKQGLIIISGNPGTGGCNRYVATSKNWRFKDNN
jgi:Leucine-rich repeat (LRR) protein